MLHAPLKLIKSNYCHVSSHFIIIIVKWAMQWLPRGSLQSIIDSFAMPRADICISCNIIVMLCI